MSSKKISLTVLPEFTGQRLDRYLAVHPEIGSRTRAQWLIEKEFVLLQGKSPKPSLLVSEGQVFQVELPEIESVEEIKPFNFPLDILFEDQDLIVINKPSGLVVHPAVGHSSDTLVNALIHHTRDLSMKFGEQRPGIVHRLDKETSGILVIAKNDLSHEKLAQQFKQRSIHRLYVAVVLGEIKEKKLDIQSYLDRHPNDRKKRASVRNKQKQIVRNFSAEQEKGKWAVTHAEKLQTSSGMTLCKVRLETGRTHQIRVHLSEAGFPIVGDRVYGADKKMKTLKSQNIKKQIESLDRFLLHAGELEFVHPRTEEKLSFRVDWPLPIINLLKDWGFQNENYK